MILKSFLYTLSTIFFSTSFRHQLLVIFFDNYFLQHSTPASLSNNIEKSCHMTAFFVILRQISTAFDIQCEKCCRITLNYVENCYRKLLSYFNVEIYYRKRLSNYDSTIFFDIFLHKKSGDAKNVVVLCRNLLSKKTVVEIYCLKFLAKNVGEIYCRKKLS